MAQPTQPVADSVPKINNELAVGDDLEFQRRWWRFEHSIWILFALIVLADLLGCFGRGYLAKAEVRTADGITNIKYERVERFSTPSILSVRFGQNAVRDSKINLWVSDTLMKSLGNQRISPQPSTSTLYQNGVLYTFDAASNPGSVEFALEPAKPGVFPLTMQVAGSTPVQLKIYVMP